MAGDDFYFLFLTKHNTTQYKHLDLLFLELKNENLKINNN